MLMLELGLCVHSGIGCAWLAWWCFLLRPDAPSLHHKQYMYIYTRFCWRLRPVHAFCGKSNANVGPRSPGPQSHTRSGLCCVLNRQRSNGGSRGDTDKPVSVPRALMAVEAAEGFILCNGALT